MIEFETICALATPSGEGAIGVIRLSGEKAIEIADKIFYNPKGKHILIDAKSHTAHFGNIIKILKCGKTVNNIYGIGAFFLRN